MIDEKKLAEFRKVVIAHDDPLIEALDTIEALLKIARCAEREHRNRMGDAYMNGADCTLCDALRALKALPPDGGGE